MTHYYQGDRVQLTLDEGLLGTQSDRAQLTLVEGLLGTQGGPAPSSIPANRQRTMQHVSQQVTTKVHSSRTRQSTRQRTTQRTMQWTIHLHTAHKSGGWRGEQRIGVKQWSECTRGALGWGVEQWGGGLSSGWGGG